VLLLFATMSSAQLSQYYDLQLHYDGTQFRLKSMAVEPLDGTVSFPEAGDKEYLIIDSSGNIIYRGHFYLQDSFFLEGDLIDVPDQETPFLSSAAKLSQYNLNLNIPYVPGQKIQLRDNGKTIYEADIGSLDIGKTSNTDALHVDLQNNIIATRPSTQGAVEKPSGKEFFRVITILIIAILVLILLFFLMRLKRKS